MNRMTHVSMCLVLAGCMAIWVMPAGASQSAEPLPEGNTTTTAPTASLTPQIPDYLVDFLDTRYAIQGGTTEDISDEVIAERNAAERINDWLVARGLGATVAALIRWSAVILAVLLAGWLANLVAKRLLLVALRYVIQRTKTMWDDIMLQKKVFHRLSHLAPALVIYYAAKYGLAEGSPAASVIMRAAAVYMIGIGMLVIDSLLSAVVDIYRTFDVSIRRPIKGYVQVAKIIIYCVGGGLILCIIIGKNPGYFLGGLGAFTAVLLLLFKDSILGLVAGVQLTRNDMVRIGDWIEMPKYGADGDVIDISLHTIKVQNWDKTISTIPAYALISDSFKNWRGMSESGGRRIKRALYIDMSSIKFCTDQMLDRFEEFEYIKDYVRRKRKEVTVYNTEHGLDNSVPINGRRLTNIGTFRAYCEAYLRNHPKIHQDLTFLIRQLAPTEHGLPLEIYVFSNDQIWAHYESIQSDIFDHLLAVVSQFELRVFQNPTGSDLANAARHLQV